MWLSQPSDSRWGKGPSIYIVNYGNCWKNADVADSYFQHCMFINVNISGAKFTRCKFEECQVDGLIIDGETRLDGSTFDSSSQVVGVLRKLEDEEASLKNYVPDECRVILQQVGSSFESPIDVVETIEPVRPQLRRVLDAFLRIFVRNTGVNEDVARTKLGTRYGTFYNKILPDLLKYNVVRLATYSGGGHQDRWGVNYPIEKILIAENPRSNAPSNLRSFWEKLRAS